MMESGDCANDPLGKAAEKKSGFVERLLSSVLGDQRPLDCAQMEITSVCMGECAYCPHSTQKKGWRSRHMPAEIMAASWPLLRKSRRVHLQGWGEPLLHPRFFDFASFVRRAGCEASTTTSGLVMDEKIARKIAASGMDLVAFSLAGTDSESNGIRRNVPFEKVCDSIRILRNVIGEGNKNRPMLNLAYLLLADRMEAASRLPELMEKLDVDMAVVSSLDYEASPDHAKMAFSPFETGKIERARQILQKAAASARDAGRFIYYALPEQEPRGKPDGCRENVVRSLYIDADGNVSPCVYLNAPGDDGPEKRRIFGNVLKEDPLQIWRKKAFADFRKKLLRNKPDAVCFKCPKRFEKGAGF